MRLIYLFYCEKMAEEPGTPWDKDATSEHPLMTGHMRAEGFFYLWQQLVRDGTFDEVVIVLTTRHWTGQIHYEPGLTGLIVPHIEDLGAFIRPGDLLFVRGCFKPWHSWLVKQQERGHWLFLYPANTGRERKTLWDVVFEDRYEQYRVDQRGRFWLPFQKPTNEDLFQCARQPYKYDVCIGLSNVYDKKKQWEAVHVIASYQTIYGEKLRCILPGSRRKSTQTLEIPQCVQDYELDLERPGWIPREQVAALLNKTKLLIMIAGFGQNDRGPLEALACGTPVFLRRMRGRTPLLHRNPRIAHVIEQTDDYEEAAHELHQCLTHIDERTHAEAREYYLQTHGMQQAILPRMREFFGVLKNCPHRNPSVLWSYYGDRLVVA